MEASDDLENELPLNVSFAARRLLVPSCQIMPTTSIPRFTNVGYFWTLPVASISKVAGEVRADGGAEGFPALSDIATNFQLFPASAALAAQNRPPESITDENATPFSPRPTLVLLPHEIVLEASAIVPRT